MHSTYIVWGLWVMGVRVINGRNNLVGTLIITMYCEARLSGLCDLCDLLLARSKEDRISYLGLSARRLYPCAHGRSHSC